MSTEKRNLDVIIIGAGPAGLSAGIWCNDLGLRAVVLEKQPEPGGQLLSIYNPITNYPGLRTENGREMRDRFLETADSYGVDIRLSTEVVEIDTETKSVITADGQHFSARSIILATGVRRRRLNIPGETEFIGRGIIESGARDKELTRNKTVAIIGGGDAALENALILSDHAKKIYIIHRRSEFRARSEFTAAASCNSRIAFLMETAVNSINGPNKIGSIELTDLRTGVVSEFPTDIVLIRTGVEPNNQLVQPKFNLDPNGYLLIDGRCQASVPAIFAIGDIASPSAPTIITAAGMGPVAAKAARFLLI